MMAAQKVSENDYLAKQILFDETFRNTPYKSRVKYFRYIRTKFLIGIVFFSVDVFLRFYLSNF